MYNITVALIYITILFYIGYRSYRKIKGIESFYTSGRSGGSVMITSSLLATIIGGSSTLGLAGLAYKNGLTGAWWLLAGSIGLLLLSATLSGRVRDMNVYTLPEILRKQYNSKKLQVVSSVVISISWLGIITGQIVAAGKILSVIWPGNSTLLIIIAGSVFLIYTAMGGQYSIIRTDLLQLILILSALTACLYFGYREVGSMENIFSKIPADFSSFPVSKTFTAKNIMIYLVFIGSSYLIGPDIYSRIFCAKDSRTALKSTLATAMAIIPIAFAIAVTGIIAKVLLPGISAETALPQLIVKVIPTGFSVLIFFALLSALMSSADTCLMTVGTIMVRDVYIPITKGETGEEKQIRLSRIVIVITGTIAIIMGIYLDSIVKSLLLAYTIYSSAFLLPVILGFFREKLKINASGALVSVVICGGLSIYLKLFIPQYLLYIFPLSLVILLTASRLFERVEKEIS